MSDVAKRRAPVAFAGVFVASLLSILAAPALSSARIVPNSSIHGLRLGASYSSVISRLGPPGRVRTGFDGVLGATRTVSWGGLTIVFSAAASSTGLIAEGISTTSRRERTSRGIGVGSSFNQLRRSFPGLRCWRNSPRGCTLVRPQGGRPYTEFWLNSRGRVVEVSISRWTD